MSSAFQYKPRFVDIRVKPPRPEEEGAEDVLRLKPGEKPCEWPGCSRAGSARAPKSREHIGDHYWFCQPHAGEYNRNWDFFAGMSEGEVRRHQEDALTGHRPTWQFKASRNSREAAAFASKFGGPASGPGSWSDPFDMFARRARDEAALRAAHEDRRVGKLERAALADLDLEPGVEPAAIRARYTELLKRCHPDVNGGDRGAEHKLQRVIKAYKTLKAAKLA